MLVADVGGEEFHVAPAGGIAGGGDQRRDQVKSGRDRERAGRDDCRELSGIVGRIGGHVPVLYHESPGHYHA
jgi:hypothetical protein